jgi:hypothetical protein
MMAHLRESAAATAAAEAREQAAIKQEAISTIRWNKCPFFVGKCLSDGYWRKCPNVLPPFSALIGEVHRWQGDFSLTLPGNVLFTQPKPLYWSVSFTDDQYFYLNRDGSFYWSDGGPGNVNAYGRSIYLSPGDEMFFKPSSKDGGSFFTGIDIHTR